MPIGLTMDNRIPLLVLMGALLAYFTMRAGKSGRMIVKGIVVLRSESPDLFRGALIMRWGLVAIDAVLVLLIVLGWGPLSSN